MLVTSCLIPFLTLVVVAWIAKMVIEGLTKQKIELNTPILESPKISHSIGNE